MAKSDPQMRLRLPPEDKAFIDAQAKRFSTSHNAEVVRCIREKREREALLTK